MSFALNWEMRRAAILGRTAEMNGLLDRGAEVNSTDWQVSRPSAAAGLAPPPTSARGSLRTPCPRRGRTTAPPTAALALGRPRRRLLSLSALPLQCG